MKTYNIWQLQNDLGDYGFWYCVWMGNDLWAIFVAWQMIRHHNKKYSMLT